MSDHRFTLDGVAVHVTRHCVERYAERVRSNIDPTPDELRRYCGEIEKLLRMDVRGTGDAPEWCGEVLNEDSAAGRADWYLLTGDDIAFPAIQRTSDVTQRINMHLRTTLTRGGISPEQRARRNNKKSHRRRLSRERRAYESWIGERSRWN